MSHIFLPKGLLNQQARFLVAVAKGEADEAQRLLTQLKLTGRGDPINVPDEAGLCPLHIAAAQGHKAVCQLLVKHGANVNQLTATVGDSAEQRMCLHFAAMAGDAATMKYLIVAGADPHSVDAFGKKPYAFCRDIGTRKYLLIAMESWNNMLVAKDLLVKACMAQVLTLTQPSTQIDSPHPRRLVSTYDAWYNELQKIRKENGVNIPISSPPKPSFLRASRHNPRLGVYYIVDRKQEEGSLNCFSAVIHAEALKYLGEDAIKIEGFYVRKDMRRTRMGTLMMYQLLTTYARLQFSHALCSIADSNHVAQTFFRKMGFKSLLPDAVPAIHNKPMHTFFEVQYIGLALAKIEHYLDHYKDVRVIDDDDHMTDENERVRQARQRRIDEKNAAKKEARSSEHGAFFLGLEKALGVHGEKAMKIAKGEGSDVGWWLKDPPVPLFHNGKQIPLVELPKAEDLLRTREPFLPPIPPPAEQADSPLRKMGGSTKRFGSNSLPELGGKHLDDDDDGYIHMSKVTTELDRVPEHILKQYEKQVVMHRDLANEVSRVTFKNEGRLSKILRHEDPGRTQEYLSEFDHYEACYTVKRNLFPEGVYGAKPKPRFNCASVEAPSWNRGSHKQQFSYNPNSTSWQGYNFTGGRASRSKMVSDTD